MTILDPQTTVGDLVKDRPARSRVFEDLKIDYCCGGKLPLAEPVQNAGSIRSPSFGSCRV